jgi:ubiquinone/menaquinone biosynthesis C-methylase UbiE
MRLNRVEFIAMNNPIRRWMQKTIEFPTFARLLEKHNIDLNGSSILDAGCGSGYSTRLLESRYHPREMVAFDLMPEQIERAQKAKNRDSEADYNVGDIANISSPSNKYDAVFVFGVLHHVPEWKRALQEIYRVLKPKGVLLIEEVNKRTVDFADRYLHSYHPKEARFEWAVFTQELQRVGFHIIDDSRIILDGFHAYLCMKPVANGR